MPPGFAHGFVVTGENALFSYKCTEYYAPEHDGSILWNDPGIGIEWPLETPSLSDKDRAAPPLDAMPERGCRAMRKAGMSDAGSFGLLEEHVFLELRTAGDPG